MNEIFLKALRCEPLERPPLWIMRQAGRYLPQYRQMREQFSFQTLIHTPELAARVTQLPLELLNFDAAILFSDILVICEVFGFSIQFKEGQGIRLNPPLSPVIFPVEETLVYVRETIKLLKSSLQVPLIGFCGGAYTVCRYMNQVTPEWLDKVTAATIDYVKLQIEAGVDVIQIFDSWAGLLSHEQFYAWALPYLRQLVRFIQSMGAKVIVFCRGSSRFIPELVDLVPSALGFDWEQPLSQIAPQIPAQIAIQGNLNPSYLKASWPLLKQEVKILLSQMKGRPGYIFNLGHGIEPDTPVDHVRRLVHYIQESSL